MAEYIGDVNPNELTGGIEDDYINGMEGDDTLRGDGGNDTIYGDLGNDVLNGGAENDSLYGGASDDWIEGDEGNDMLNGGADNDILIGGAGNDTLDGGTGNDMIYGGSCYDGYGNDTYIFGRGYGQDVIFDYDGTSGNIDIIMFNANVTPADVSVKADGDGNLILSINGSDDTLMVAGYFSNPSNQIEEIRFSDGTIWDVNEIYRQEILSATENDDFIYGADQTDTISGLGGNDYIIGGAGNDTLGGDADADTLHGGDDNDSLIGGAGNDLLLGDGGDDTLDGGTGNDTLMGGDYYWGGYGNNTYIFGRGYGQDVIYDGGSHIILLNSDVTPTDDDISLGANSDGDLILYIGADTLTVAKYYEYSNYQQLQIQFQNENGEITTTWNPAEINVAPVVKKPFGGTVIVKEGSEYTLSIDLDAFIDFNVGDSLTYTATLADDSPLPAWVTFDPATLIFTGTPPDDSIGTWHIKVTATDTSGLSVSEYVDAIVVPEWAIFGTEDDDALPGTENNDIIVGLGGHDTLGGSETMYEGTGADTMYGGAGGDSYLVDDPGDVVIEFSGEGQGEGNDGVASMISYTLPNNVENLSLIGTADINGTGNDNPNMIIGNSGDNIISGGGGDDWLCGGLDTTGLLFGNLGDDTIIGGTGNDWVAGFGYNETFVFSRGDGNEDVIFNCNPEGVDKIQFTEGISSTDPVFVRLGNDLIIYIDDNTVENDAGFFEPRTFGLGDALALGVDVIVLSDGQYLTREDILNIADAMSDINDDPSLDVWQKIDAMKSSQEYQDLLAASWHSSAPTPTAGDDVLYGTDGNDTINALGGHDIVYGLSGDDSLAGGAGNDTLYGASGNDTLNGGAGNDQLLAGDGNDTLNGGAGADVMIGGSGDDIYYVDNTGDVITENSNEGTDTIRSSVSYTISDNVENMTLTGTDAINGTGNVLDNRIIGNTAANTLSGEAGNDYLSGGAGDDQLLGGDGDDTLLGGTGVDVLTGGAGNDSLNGGDDDDQLLGGAGNDTLLGSAGSDILTGGVGNDLLNGGDGDDLLRGEDGDDTLVGGAGSDFMTGGAGNDTYYVDNGGDWITENAGTDIDIIRSSISYTISDNVENMTLTGTDAIDGTGNVLDNRIIGNTAANTLSGQAGNDYLSGGAGADILNGGEGNDTLTGGDGSDTYLFGNNDGRDRINETAGITGDIDALKLTEATITEPVIVKDGNNLYVFIDANNYVRVASEFQATSYGIERLEVSDGHYITRDDIQTIVDTMSAINDSGMGVIQKYNAMMESEQYQNILSESWQQ